MMSVAVYPGTFDPITNGHMDIILRAARLVDRLIVAVAENTGKEPVFNIDERVELLEAELAALPEPPANVEVRRFGVLLLHFTQSVGAQMIVRGLRAVSDFEYEFQMAGMNAKLDRSIETMFLMASDRYQFISSRFVKAIGELGGDIAHFVGPVVAKRLVAHYKVNGVLARRSAT